MGHKSPPDIAELQKKNFAAFNAWLSSNRKKLEPKANKAVIYAGYSPSELQKAKTLLGGTDGLTKMWETIKEINKDIKKYEGQVKFDLLTDVLKRLTNPPELYFTQGGNAGTLDRQPNNMLDYVQRLTDAKAAYIDKGKISGIWDRLSEAYVENSKGDVTLLEGRTKDNKRVTAAFTMVRKELETLWKRKDLPEATKKNAAAMISGFMNYYDGQQQLSEQMVKEAREVMKQSRIAVKGR